MIELVKRAMKSDTDAFMELMERQSLSMYKVARAMLKNDADVADVMQDTILTCFEKLDTLRKPEYFKTWMIRILINKCNKVIQHYKTYDLPEEFPEIGNSDMSLAEFEFKEMLVKIDEKYRVILVLYYVEGFKIPEIAELLELKENTVKTRLARGREQIRGEYMADTEIKKGGNGNEKKRYMSGRRNEEKNESAISIAVSGGNGKERCV